MSARLEAVVFDLDDTLYTERDFVDSGFRAVARVLARRSSVDEAALFERMRAILAAEGRGRVFDRILDEIPGRRRTPDDVRWLVHVYRSHRPHIALRPESRAVLGTLRSAGYRLGLVTDGAATVQRNKIVALGLEPLVDEVVCTDEIGREWWKPSTTPFNVVLALLDVDAREAAYVGNDPGKDFAGPNALGMLTIQVGGEAAGLDIPGHFRATHAVGSIADVLPLVGCPSSV